MANAQVCSTTKLVAADLASSTSSVVRLVYGDVPTRSKPTRCWLQIYNEKEPWIGSRDRNGEPRREDDVGRLVRAINGSSAEPAGSSAARPPLFVSRWAKASNGLPRRPPQRCDDLGGQFFLGLISSAERQLPVSRRNHTSVAAVSIADVDRRVSCSCESCAARKHESSAQGYYSS